MTIKTRVVWVWSATTEEQRQERAAFAAAPVTSDILEELNARASELSNYNNTPTLEIIEDSSNQLHRYIRIREWPDQATAEDWIKYVLSKGAESAVVIEE